MNLPPAAPAPTRGIEDKRWFADEVHPHHAQLEAYLRTSFPRVRDVEDVVQESYLRMWRARAGQPIRSAKAFLFKVARRVALDWLRHERVSPINAVGNLDELHVFDEKPGVSELVSTREKVRMVAAALVTLPPRCREVVMLSKLKGFSREEVASALGISEKTVDEHLSRGVKRLEKHLQARGIESYYR